MTVTPEEVLAFAENLTANCESGVRTALSRAYYAAFHCADQFHNELPTPGNVTRMEGVHGTLYQRLLSPNIPSADPRHTVSRKIGVLGQHMHGLRIRADYRLTESVTEADKELVIREARKLFDLAKE